LAFRYPPADTPVHDQFQSYTRSAATVLVYGAIVALLIGLAAGTLNVWQLRDQFSGATPDFDTWRFYVLNFLQSFAVYGLMATVLFAGGMIVNCLAWFYAALSSDFDDLYDDDAETPQAPLTPPPTNPSDWTKPIGAD
jgi:hypothetical protein